jgi:hypothetical protein
MLLTTVAFFVRKLRKAYIFVIFSMISSRVRLRAGGQVEEQMPTKGPSVQVSKTHSFCIWFFLKAAKVFFRLKI